MRLVLDTGAAESSIRPDILDELGYSARQGDAITTLHSALLGLNFLRHFNYEIRSAEGRILAERLS